MLRSCVCMHCVCIAGAKHASDLTFCSWKVPLWWMRTPLLFCFSSTALSVLMIPRVWYGPDYRCPKAFCTVSQRFLIRFAIEKLKAPLEHAVNKASELSRPHLSTRLCNSSLCVSMLCFETVLVCIVTMLTNCGPFNRRSRTCLEACCKWLQGT